ncbi:MAG: flagellar biosynthetic protein FliO [Gallionella sp.]|nr:flagellar biosynthetic protein FliO [Gallionella sp.]
MFRLSRLFLAVGMLAAPAWAAAVEGTRPAYTPPPPAAISSGSIVQVILSLLLVLAAIVLVAWVLKRMNMVQQGHGNALKVLGGVAIGQRERIVLVEVEDTWLLVGVGPNQLRTLHTLPKPEHAEELSAAADTQTAVGNRKFANILSAIIRPPRTTKDRNAP